MEANNHTTLTTAAAWRAAISLTCADVRTFLANAFFVLKALLVLVYLFAGVILVFNESDTLLPNIAGILMLAASSIFFRHD